MKGQITDERYYWLWLQELIGIGSDKVLDIFKNFSSPKEFYEAEISKIIAADILTDNEILKINKTFNKKFLDILKYCDQNNIRMVTYLSDEYPECLRVTEAPPLLLFVRGESLMNIFPAFGVVGTRKATELGEKSAFSVAAKLSLAGFTIVSGGALGVDKMAHIGAIAAGGKTVVVLGCGIDSNYLKSNKAMRDAAEIKGALVSEFLPKSTAKRYNFPIRNRIISALSSGVAVIEAGEKSGALITANYAAEQGKEVFTVPGSIEKEEYKGNNRLIKDGAIPITDIEDILNVYEGRFGDIINRNIKLTKGITAVLYAELEKRKNKIGYKAVKSSKYKNNKTENNNLSEKMPLKIKTFSANNLKCSDNGKRIMECFCEEIMSADVLSAKSKVLGAEFLTAVTELELKGYIKAVPVGRYKILTDK